MVETRSTMAPIGMDAPDFSLPDTQGSVVSLADFKGAPAFLVMFICNHCPFVKHLQVELASLVEDHQEMGLAAVAINSNDFSKYPDDSPQRMKEEEKNAGYTFPYLIDEDQSVARKYRASCTPDFFLFDKEQKLYYRGQFDETRPSCGTESDGKDLLEAIKFLKSGYPAPEHQKPAIGCNIKWKP